MLKLNKSGLQKTQRPAVRNLFILLALCALSIHFASNSVKEDLKRESLAGFVACIHFYRKVISPSGAPECAFHPSCSIYAKACFEEYGWAEGLLMTFDRLSRCNQESWIYPRIEERGSEKKGDFPN